MYAGAFATCIDLTDGDHGSLAQLEDRDPRHKPRPAADLATERSRVPTRLRPLSGTGVAHSRLARPDQPAPRCGCRSWWRTGLPSGCRSGWSRPDSSLTREVRFAPAARCRHRGRRQAGPACARLIATLAEPHGVARQPGEACRDARSHVPDSSARLRRHHDRRRRFGGSLRSRLGSAVETLGGAA